MNGSSTIECAAQSGELTDEQWALVGPLIPEPPRRADRRGRPWRDAREVLSGVLWVLRRDAKWRDLPSRFPPHQTCCRRCQEWSSDGTLRLVLEALERDLRGRGRLDITECLFDDRFVKASGGGEGTSLEQEGLSWQRRTAMLLLSPATRGLLRRMESRLGRRLRLGFISASLPRI